MSFKSFSAINSWIQNHFFPAQLEALWQFLGQLRMNVQLVNMVAERYGSVYSTVEQTSYDSQGTASDVTSPERQTVPDSVVSAQIQALRNAQATTNNLAARADGVITCQADASSTWGWVDSHAMADLCPNCVGFNVQAGPWPQITIDIGNGSLWSYNNGKLLAASSTPVYGKARFLSFPSTGTPSRALNVVQIAERAGARLWWFYPCQSNHALCQDHYFVMCSRGEFKAYKAELTPNGDRVMVGIGLYPQHVAYSAPTLLGIYNQVSGGQQQTSLALTTWGDNYATALETGYIERLFTGPILNVQVGATLDVASAQSIADLSLQPLIDELLQI